MFQDLKSFSLTTEVFNAGNFALPDFEEGKKMLIEQCPNLEVHNFQIFVIQCIYIIFLPRS